MAKKSRETKIKELNDYIWTLEGKCEKVNKINTGLILQYCRFMVLADELSIEIAKNIGIQTIFVSKFRPAAVKDEDLIDITDGLNPFHQQSSDIGTDETISSEKKG